MEIRSSAPGPDELAQSRGVLAEAVAEALVGEVDERQQAALLDDVADLLPQGGGGVHAGRVVAGAVEQDDVARATLRRAPRAARPRRSGARSGPCTGRSGSGSPPAGTAAGGSARSARSSRSSARPGLAEEVRRDAQAAGPAGRLGGERSPGRHGLVAGARGRGPARLAVGGVAVDGAVELGPAAAARRRSASITEGRTGVLPVSSTKTPDDRLILPGRGSVRNASARPRIGSGGAGMRASDGRATVVTFRGRLNGTPVLSLSARRGCGPVTPATEPAGRRAAGFGATRSVPHRSRRYGGLPRHPCPVPPRRPPGAVLDGVAVDPRRSPGFG